MESIDGPASAAVTKALAGFETKTEKQRESHRKTLAESFAKKGISGSAVLPNVNADPEWARVKLEMNPATGFARCGCVAIHITEHGSERSLADHRHSALSIHGEANARSRFHLQGQHDQQDHAGGRGGKAEKGKTSRPKGREEVDPDFEQYKADIAAYAKERGVPIEFGMLYDRLKVGSYDGNVAGNFDPQTGKITMDMRSMFMMPPSATMGVLRHEISDAQLYAAWHDPTSGVNDFINKNFAAFKREGKLNPSEYAKAWWRKVERTPTRDKAKWVEVAARAVMESVAELHSDFPDGKFPKGMKLHTKLESLVQSHWKKRRG